MKGAIVSAIAFYGTRYREEYLAKYRAEALLTNWWLALDFFLAHACFQGRRDDISEKVYQSIVRVLSAHFADDNRTANFHCLRARDWTPLRQQLEAVVGKGKVGKQRDLQMVLSGLAYIGRLPDLNIVACSLGQIRQGLIDKHYARLQASQSEYGIVQVGPKIAAFYLRDLVSLYRLDDQVASAPALCLQPVDVWVGRIARKIGIVTEGASPSAIASAIKVLCQAQGISPTLFNQGVWYMGYHALDLLLDRLGAEGQQSSPR